MALFRKKLIVERDINDVPVASGREQYNFTDENGNLLHVFEINAKNSWISTNPTTFGGKAIGLGTTCICVEDWSVSIFDGTNWNIG